jgi:GNAT superfamily N-acetyltransferase
VSTLGRMRHAAPSDAVTIARHRYPDDPNEEAVQAYAEWVRGAIVCESYIGWLIVLEGEVVAGAGVTILDWGPNRSDASPLLARVVNVYTAEAWRRRGLARRLVGKCLASARARGISRFNLSSTDEARGLYVGLGFEPVTREFRLTVQEQKSGDQ